MNNFNISLIEGNLVKDPALKKIGDNDSSLCYFTLGSNRTYTKKDGEKVTEANFIDIRVWNKLAEVCEKYLSKGSRVIVSGNLRKDTWEDENGDYQSRTYIDGKEVNFLNKQSEGEDIVLA